MIISREEYIDKYGKNSYYDVLSKLHFSAFKSSVNNKDIDSWNSDTILIVMDDDTAVAVVRYKFISRDSKDESQAKYFSIIENKHNIAMYLSDIYSIRSGAGVELLGYVKSISSIIILRAHTKELIPYYKKQGFDLVENKPKNLRGNLMVYINKDKGNRKMKRNIKDRINANKAVDNESLVLAVGAGIVALGAAGLAWTAKQMSKKNDIVDDMKKELDSIDASIKSNTKNTADITVESQLSYTMVKQYVDVDVSIVKDQKDKTRAINILLYVHNAIERYIDNDSVYNDVLDIAEKVLNAVDKNIVAGVKKGKLRKLSKNEYDVELLKTNTYSKIKDTARSNALSQIEFIDSFINSNEWLEKREKISSNIINKHKKIIDRYESLMGKIADVLEIGIIVKDVDSEEYDGGNDGEVTPKLYRKTKTTPFIPWNDSMDMTGVSILDRDKEAGSPKLGDMIGINPNDSTDRWLVEESTFLANYELVEDTPVSNVVITNELPNDGSVDAEGFLDGLKGYLVLLIKHHIINQTISQQKG